jgi:DNA-binding transcriptional ArsR family regulator
MGISKTIQLSDTHNRLTVMLKALGHPARLAIIEHLRKVNTCICNDIVNELPLAQPTISQHLKELKSAGLIEGSIEGNTICYCINKEAIKELDLYFQALNDNLKNTHFKCC